MVHRGASVQFHRARMTICNGDTDRNIMIRRKTAEARDQHAVDLNDLLQLPCPLAGVIKTVAVRSRARVRPLPDEALA